MEKVQRIQESLIIPVLKLKSTCWHFLDQVSKLGVILFHSWFPPESSFLSHERKPELAMEQFSQPVPAAVYFVLPFSPSK